MKKTPTPIPSCSHCGSQLVDDAGDCFDCFDREMRLAEEETEIERNYSRLQEHEPWPGLF